MSADAATPFATRYKARSCSRAATRAKGTIRPRPPL